MVSFRSARKLSGYLVLAKLWPIERRVDSCRCNKRHCQVCVSVNQTYMFSSSVTQETYKLKDELDCKNKCLIFLLACKKLTVVLNSMLLRPQTVPTWEGTITKTILASDYRQKHLNEDVLITLIGKADPWQKIQSQDKHLYKYKCIHIWY